jgi:hypothetical protein
MTVCAEHVEYQLLNSYLRVGFVLDAIESDDAGLQAAMAMVNIMDDTGINGKRGDFEAAIAYLLPKDPVVKKRNLSHENGGKRAAAYISWQCQLCEQRCKQVGKAKAKDVLNEQVLVQQSNYGCNLHKGIGEKLAEKGKGSGVG